MTVYVDVLFWLNTIINYLLLRGSAAIGGCPAGFWRMVAAAIMGGLYAVASVMPGWSILQGAVFQIISAVAMLLVAFGWKQSTVKQGLFFFALSFAFGGAVLLVVQLAEPDCLFLGSRAYYAVTTPALLLLAGLSYGFAAVILSGWGTHTGGDIVQMELELNGKRTGLRALQDTGNTLRDPMTGQGILVADWKILQILLPDAGLTRQHFCDPSALLQKLAGEYPKLRFRLVTYEAVGVPCGMLPAVRCRVRQGKRQKQVLVAFTATEVSCHGQFEALTGGVMT